MSVLIYGGSFNPPHLGHVDALRSAAEAIRPDHILAIPAGMPPHKQMDSGSPDADARLRLAELAFRDVPGTKVLDIELKRLGKSYTVETLQEIADRYELGESLVKMTLLRSRNSLRAFLEQEGVTI